MARLSKPADDRKVCNLTVPLTSGVAARLTEIAMHRGATRTQIARRLIEEGLGRLDQTPTLITAGESNG
jgi:predicted transcriptional regulator